MFNFLSPVLVVGIICAGVYGLFELFVRKKERLALIEKLGDKLGAPGFEGKICLPSYAGVKISFNALKVGALLLGIGLGLFVGYIVCMATLPNYAQSNDRHIREVAGVVYGSSVLIFGGLSLILAFLAEVNIVNKDKEKN